jgi:hypothetical protein
VPEYDIMSNTLGTVTVWQSGRLAPQAIERRFEFTREQWMVAALLAASALVLALYVAVLERDVGRSELQHVAQRSRAIAEAQCEADQPAERRGRCIALFNGDVVAAQAAAPAPVPAPTNALYEQENAARAMTVSLVGER